MDDDSMLPPPLVVTTPAATPPPPAYAPMRNSSIGSPSNSRSSSAGAEDASMSDVLLRRRLAIHWMSRMYHFRRHELASYAHDLVTSLRGEALAAFRREFGYKVSIRHTDAYVAFDVLEERDAGDVDMEPLKELPGGHQAADTVRSSISGFVGPVKYDPSRRRGSSSTAKQQSSDEGKDADETAAHQRQGGFVLYFPLDEEENERTSMSQRTIKETQYVVLLRGNEKLLSWTCAWLQTRFQCIVSAQRVRISPANLKWLARNWVVDSLLREEEITEKASQPVLLKYKNLDEHSMVREYTLTVPWATLRRLCEQAKLESSAPNAIPELIRMTEELYFETLPLNMAAFELQSFEMAEVSVDQSGRVEFSSMTFVHSVLRGLTDLLCIQKVPGPAKPVMTL